MVGVGWLVLGLVFLDELFAMAAMGVWGWHVGDPRAVSLLLAVLLPVLTMLVWFFFASPKATYGGPVVRPLVKVLVFATASVALWASGHRVLGVLMLAFSVVVNAAAQVPWIRDLASDDPRAAG